MTRLVSNRWVQIILLLLLLGEAVTLRLQDPPIVQRWRQLTFDAYNRIIPRPQGNGVVIVDIDEDSLRRYGQWPWPRPQVAQIPEILRQFGARAVAFDVVFAEPDRTSPHLLAESLPQTPDMEIVAQKLKSLPDNDHVFAQRIAAAGNVVAGFVAANQPTMHQPLLKATFFNEGLKADPLKFIETVSYFTTSLPEIVAGAAGNGSFTITPEEDGIVRRVPLLIGQRFEDGQIKMYPALPLEALRVALGKTIYKIKSFGERTQRGFGIQDISIGDYTIPTDKRGAFQVYYAGHRKDLYIPAWKVLSRDFSPDQVRDKIVLVGTSAIGLLDLRSSPLNAVVPGVEVHAEIIEQILDKKFLQRPDFFNGAELCLTVIVSLLIIFLAPFIGTATQALLGGLLMTGSVAGALYAYKHFGYLLDPVYPMLSILVIFIFSSILTNLRTEMERRAVRNAFSHYISPSLMEELTRDPDKLKLGGEVRELSVMFTDIRNFTTISESMDPAELIKMMNDFLTPMTSCVLDNRGMVDKYMGDAMMAFWNAPLDDPEHARHACTAALQMLEALSKVNENLQAEARRNNKAFPVLHAGIGIHTGPCSVGNMGSRQRFAYSALGDTVNLASRLEGQTKHYGISVMLSEETLKAAPEFAALEVDLVTVKGRTEPERVYTLIGDSGVALSPDFMELKSIHDRMLAAYRAQDWNNALDLAGRCSALRPDIAGLYALYRERIASFKTIPPAPGWTGVWVAKDK
jgi:adenylate cyclase